MRQGMRIRIAGVLAAVAAVGALVACSPSPAVTSLPSPSAAPFAYVGSLGSAGCDPAAQFHDSQGGGLPETGIDSARGSLWALFFGPLPATAGAEIKVVWRMTGSGAFTFHVTDEQGGEIPLAWGPEAHGSSTWSHPGDEVGTGIDFTHAGCWAIHVMRSRASGDLWLRVV